MIRLITPPGMLLTVALLAIYSVCAFLIGRIEDSWPLQVASLVAIVASYGTARLRPWSRYLVYLLAAGFVIKMALSIVQAVSAGFFDFQFRTTTGNPAVADTELDPGAAVGRMLPSRFQILPRSRTPRQTRDFLTLPIMGPATLLPIIGLALFLRRQLQIDASLGLFFATSITVLILYLGALADGLAHAALALSVVGVLLLAREIILGSRHGIRFVPPVSLVLLVVLSGVFWLRYGPTKIFFFDEYSHWGIYLKEMIARDALLGWEHKRHACPLPAWPVSLPVFFQPRCDDGL